MSAQETMHSLACLQNKAQHRVFCALKREEPTRAGNKIDLTIYERCTVISPAIIGMLDEPEGTR